MFSKTLSGHYKTVQLSYTLKQILTFHTSEGQVNIQNTKLKIDLYRS